MSSDASARVAELRQALSEGYEILPIPLIQTLIATAYAAYDPAMRAYGMSVDEAENAGRAAENVLSRAVAGLAAAHQPAAQEPTTP